MRLDLSYRKFTVLNLNGYDLSQITELDCSYNQLTTLPTLPPNLIYLDCCYNQLTVLPTLPSTLITLYCGNNKITSYPILPSTLNNLSDYNNPVFSTETTLEMIKLQQNNQKRKDLGLTIVTTLVQSTVEEIDLLWQYRVGGEKFLESKKLIL